MKNSKRPAPAAPPPSLPELPPPVRHVATARPVFEAVALRLGVDSNVLMYLFAECLREVFHEVKATGACTVRGHGKFSRVQSHTVKSVKSLEPVTVFEHSKYVTKNRPFRSLKRLTPKN